MMAAITMDPDLRVQTATFTDQLFQGRISDTEKVALEKWLSQQLEQERSGWKKKVAMSLKEVEKERRLALDVHAAVHRLNDKFQPVLQAIALFREPSLYQGADTQDFKVNHVQQLEKNLDAILTMLGKYQTERTHCFQLLGAQYMDDVPLAEVLTEKLSAAMAQLSKAEKSGKETEDRLMKEIRVLNDTIDLQQGQMSNIEKKHKKDLQSVSSTNQELKTKLLIKSAITSSSKSTQTEGLVRKTDVGVQARRASASKHSDNCSRLGNRKDRGTQTNFKPLKDKSVTFELSKSLEVLKQDLKENKMADRSDESADLKYDPITSVTIVKTPYNSGPNAFKSPSEVMQSFDILHKGYQQKSKEDITSQNSTPRYEKTPRGGYLSRSRSEPQSENPTVDYLRSQVLDYAGRLEQAQAQVEGYQQQLALLRATKQRQEVHHQSHDSLRQQNEANHEARTVLIEKAGLGGSTNRELRNSKQWKSEGYLTGRKMDDETEVYHRNRTGGGDKKLPGTAKCLRCNKMYRLKNNHSTACRYHTKPKQTVEKYDSTGKLVRMVHLWGCCSGKPDSMGCQMGQHV